MFATTDGTRYNGIIDSDAVRAAYAHARDAALRAMELLSAFDAQGGWELEGYASPVSWLVTNAAMTRVDAAREVRSARLVREYTDVADAVRAEAITPTHVHQLAGIARHRSLRFGDDVAMLVSAATHVDPEGYRRVATHWRSLADDLLAPDERDETNTLDLSQGYAGSWIMRAVFDAVRGAALHTLLLERSAPTGEDDTRSAAQRRADALYDILTNGLPVQPRIDVIVDVDTFVGVARPVEEIRCELNGIGAIEHVVMQRLACNAHIGRVLVRGAHEILELGRQVRLATPAQRRAIVARDHGCVWPHCNRPSAMCEIHHLVPWQHGGASDLDNLALLCGHHHTRTHQGWKLTPGPNNTWDATPP